MSEVLYPVASCYDLTINMRAQLHGNQTFPRLAQDILTLDDDKVPFDASGEMEVWLFSSIVNSLDELKH